MNIKLVAVLAAVGSLLACGDSGTGGAGGGTGGSDPAGGTDPGGAPATGGGGGGAALTCETGCELLFDCGLEGTPPYCVYAASDSTAFVPGCIESCNESPALLSLLTDDCEENITTIKAVNVQFKTVCEDGIPQGGGNAGGAGGGA